MNGIDIIQKKTEPEAESHSDILRQNGAEVIERTNIKNFSKKDGPIFDSKGMSMETLIEGLKPVALANYEFENRQKKKICFFRNMDSYLSAKKNKKMFNLRVIYKFKTVI